MLLFISYKRPHFKSPHSFLTVLKCFSACQLKKTVKYEIWSIFSLTWSPKFGFSRSFDIFMWNLFYNITLKYASFAKNTKSALIAMGFEQFTNSKKNDLTFSNRIFSDLFQILMIKYSRRGSQWIHGEFLLRLSVLEILLLSKCLVISVKIGQTVFAESCALWTHIEFGVALSIKLAFYCSELQCLEPISKDSQLNQGFRQYIVLLLKY